MGDQSFLFLNYQYEENIIFNVVTNITSSITKKKTVSIKNSTTLVIYKTIAKLARGGQI